MTTEVKFTDRLSCVLKDSMGDDRSLADAAWVSVYGEDTESKSDKDVQKLIPYLMRNRHGTPFEHAAMTFVVRAPLFVWREHHRHRIGVSYNEESGRYKKLQPEFYVPSRARVQEGKPGHYQIRSGSDEQTTRVSNALMETAEWAYASYESMLNAGVAREVARMCLPLNIMSSCYVTWNPRSLMHFLELRMAHQAQAEIRALAESYMAAFDQLFPVTAEAFRLNGCVAP